MVTAKILTFSRQAKKVDTLTSTVRPSTLFNFQVIDTVMAMKNPVELEDGFSGLLFQPYRVSQKKGGSRF